MKVLYVEDEPFLARIVKESLESRDFAVHLVNDGKAAVNVFEEVKPDICVLDVMLPHRDGFTLAGDIRQRNPNIPIIFLTAKNQTEDVIKGFESGGNDYLRKPFSMEELIVRINNLMVLSRKTSSVVADHIRLGQFVFHPSRYELQRGDQVRKLSHREATLLQLLAAHQNKIVNRKEILLQLWGDDSFFNSRNLDVYITKLRDYLKEDATLEIMTIKGVGYHFRVG
ncbi:MAG: response regulator transcription factor [Cyclobacteriaceae bacterium]|nr:response regulator transcription factor [Cyclobacteriaceae bacterium]